MASELIAGIGLFKTMLDMAKGLKDLNDAAVRNTAVVELQEKIISAREAQSALLESVGALEKEVADLKAWGADKQRYELAEVREGALAYRVKEEARGVEPAHWLCAQCYLDGEKSFLQNEHRDPGRCTVWACHRCGSDIYVHGEWHPEHGMLAQRTSRRRS